MSTVIRWEAPPPQQRGPSPKPRLEDEWAAVADELRTCPSQWGLIFESSSDSQAQSLAVGIKTGRFPSFYPTFAFEAVSRKRGDRAFVYARYVGGETL